MSSLVSMPQDILASIARFLPLRSLAFMRATCRAMREFVRDRTELGKRERELDAETDEELSDTIWTTSIRLEKRQRQSRLQLREDSGEDSSFGPPCAYSNIFKGACSMPSTLQCGRCKEPICRYHALECSSCKSANGCSVCSGQHPLRFCSRCDARVCSNCSIKLSGCTPGGTGFSQFSCLRCAFRFRAWVKRPGSLF